MTELSPDSILSHYRVLSKIGAGGMGEAYVAPDTSELGRTVALKILPAAAMRDKDRLQHFIPEARTVSNLNHANILTAVVVGAVLRGRPPARCNRCLREEKAVEN